MVKRIMEIYQQCSQLLDSGQSGVLAILVARSGSGSRAIGSKMLITDQKTTIGSLGGGQLDETVIQRAEEVLRSNQPILISIAPDQRDGEVCGSTVQVFLEPLTGKPVVIIAGAGHVGRAVAVTASQAGFRTVLADDRPPRPMDADLNIVHCETAAFFAQLPIPLHNNSLIVICTHSHGLDYTVLEQALATPAPYIGMLGSSRKKDSFFARLRKAGFADRELARIVTPVGLAIGAHTPEEIGVSIVAQLIEVTNQGHSLKLAG
jgi:xanthine dehydrogenase accessory factor